MADISLGKIIGLIKGIVNQVVISGQSLSIEIVETLPEVGKDNIFYLVEKENPTEKNLFDEYLWKNNNWEIIGSVGISFTIDNELSLESSNPVANKVITEALNNKVDSTELINYATKEYVNNLVGDIGQVLDSINGEVIS